MAKLTETKVKLFGRNIPILIVVVVAVLISCVACCGIFLALPTPEPTPPITEKTSEPAKTATLSPTNTTAPPTSVPTDTPKPTMTPEPTNTPRPTNTPKPTETSQPTNTPKATDTPEPTATPKATEMPGREVSKEEFGKEWPFTVERGFIDCTNLSGGLREAVFRADGVTYALNGTAQSRAEAQGYKDFSDIWRDDPDNPGLKINMGPILYLALEQCE